MTPSDQAAARRDATGGVALSTADDAAAASHALLDQALQSAEQIAYHYDAASDRLTLGGAVKSLTGREPEQIGQRLDDLLALVHRDDLAALQAIGLREGPARAATVTRFRFERPDGSCVACELRGEPFGTWSRSDVAHRHGLIGRVREDVPAPDPMMRLVELIEFLPEFVSVHTTDGRCVAINSAGRRLAGIDRREDISRTMLTDLVTDSTSVPVHLLLSVVLAQGSHGTDVVMLNRRSGRQIPAFWSAMLMNERVGGQRLLIAIARDMTEQLEIEWELRQNQRRLAHALEVSRLGEWSLDIRTQNSTQSRRVMEIFGHAGSADQWNYRAFLNHVHPDDRERVDRLFSRSLESGRDLDFEARIIRTDGELRWISARGSMNRGLGGNERVIGSVIQDITARKQTEQRDRFLADVSVPLNTLVDHRSTLEQVARLAVPFLGDHCSIDLANEKGQLTRIVSTSSLLAREAVGDSLPGTHRQPTAMRRMLEAGEVVTLDIVEAGSLDGFARTRSERLSLRALDIKSYLGVPLSLRGRHIGVMHFYRTVGESHYGAGDRNVAIELATRVAVALENARLYRALQDSDHRKDEFLAMLSHELRNPLESLSVGVSLIEHDDGAKRDWAQGMMRGQIAKLGSILEDLLDVSRYTFNKVVLNRQDTLLAPLVSTTVEEMRSKAEQRGYELVFEGPDAPLYANLDYVRISQVIGNLLTNAIKYGGDRGTLRVSVTFDDGRAAIRVSDDGVGIEPDELPNVFELFAQVDTTLDRTLGGLGMGLTLVKRIAEMHGGSISAESPGADKGSTFTLTLPASLEAAQQERRPEPRSQAGRAVPSADRRRLMLVDDNLETISALQKLFLMKGYEVETANDGLAAIALAESYRPQMAVLDIGLPGANGYEVAEALRRQYAGEPLLLIALSGYGQQKDRDRSREAGFDHHLLKPANFKAIIDLLQAE